jgi:phosphotransferase system  glucose/maltose/N-acetylglucosamine-specific IIC component
MKLTEILSFIIRALFGVSLLLSAIASLVFFVMFVGNTDDITGFNVDLVGWVLAVIFFQLFFSYFILLENEKHKERKEVYKKANKSLSERIEELLFMVERPNNWSSKYKNNILNDLKDRGFGKKF